MTREEEINNEATNYGYFVAGGCPERVSLSRGFQNGAKWADENPKSPWISVKEDLPCNHEEMIDNSVFPRIETIIVITYNKSNEIDDNFMYKRDGIWKWRKSPKPKYWCLYPEPPKE